MRVGPCGRAATLAAAGLLSFFFRTTLPAESAPPAEKVLEIGKSVPNSGQVTTTSDASTPGVAVALHPGPEGYPGIFLKPKEGDVWDLGGYGHIEAVVANAGQTPLSVTLRVDNKGDWKEKPWNTEAALIKPGEKKTIKVIFGYGSGQKPSYKLNPSAISNLLLFTGKISAESSFRLESLKVAGAPGEIPAVEPDKIRVKPKDGFVLGHGEVLETGKQVIAKSGAEAKVGPDGQTLQVTFSRDDQSITIKPPQGMWDLRDGYEVKVKIKNTGSAPITPAVRIESKPGNTDTASPAQPVAPGATAEIAASFIPATPTKLGSQDKPMPEPGTGTKFASDAASGIVLLPGSESKGQTFDVESIQLAAPPMEMPPWLGQRPPVEGDWTPTFTENFDGDAVNLTKWNIYSSNFWDKRTHFSKDNVIVAQGVATLRCEKKTGRHNDDPNGKETEVATGFLDTYGKWVQRYGYFEARMKLPAAPGMWPAFWLMPDRGMQAGEQWKRASTSDGGMEFDIMEFLSRWGGHRFSPAFHWDGYGKDHKATGVGPVYTAQDKDGFITTGILWLPGLVVIYNNGREAGRWESPRISNVPADIMFTNVTGGWDNNPLDPALLPGDFVIDYVRCWQRKDLATDQDGVKSTAATPAAPTAAVLPGH